MISYFMVRKIIMMCTFVVYLLRRMILRNFKKLLLFNYELDILCRQYIFSGKEIQDKIFKIIIYEQFYLVIMNRYDGS